MKQPLCYIRTIIRSLRHLRYVDGCSYETSKTPTPENVHVLECKVCGNKSVAWSWGSLERFK